MNTLRPLIIIILAAITIGCAKKARKNNFDISLDKAKEFMRMDSFDSAFNYCNMAIELANNYDQIGKSYWLMGYLYDIDGDATNATQYYLGASDAFLHSNQIDKVVLLLQNAGTSALNADAYEIALDYYRERLYYANKIKDDKQIALGNYEVGLAFIKLLQIDSANHYQNNVLDLVDDEGELASKAYIELGIIQFVLQNYDTARFLYNKALTRHSNKILEYKVSQNIANTYLDEGLLEDALSGFRESLSKGKLLNSSRSIIKPINGLGKTYSELGIKDSAIFYLTKVYELSEQLTNSEERKKLYALDLSRSSLMDLATNYEILEKLDPVISRQFSEKYVVGRIGDLFKQIDILKREHNKRGVEIANSNRNQKRLKKRLDDVRKANLNKTIWLICCSILIGFLIALFIKKLKKRRKFDNEANFIISETNKLINNIK